MVETNENYIVSKEVPSEEESVENIPDSDVMKILFPDVDILLDISNIPIQTSQLLFDGIMTWSFDFDNQKKDEKIKITETITQYIKNPTTKEYVLNQYIKNLSNTPKWLEPIITSTYSREDIWEQELLLYFNENTDIVTMWKDIIWPDWDWNNIDNNIDISATCPCVFLTEEQFVKEFNKFNHHRKEWNINMMRNIDFSNIDLWDLGVYKRKGKFYIWDKLITDESLLSNQKILDYINNSHKFSYVTDNELKNDLQFIPNWQINLLRENIKNLELKDEDENYNLHESGLNFYKEYKLADKKDILNAFENWDYEMLEKKHNKLQEIMNLLEIQEDDIPDLKEEKARLIYLLNHGLFRSFQLEVWAIPSNLSMFDNKAVLWESTLNALYKHLNRYNTEKSPEFFQLLEDIKNINVDIDWALQNSKISEELNNDQKISNVSYVVDMFKYIFIQRVKNGTCDIKNIESFKHQIAYILATLHHECRYQHDAHRKWSSFRWFGQINGKYTTFWTNFIQQSWIEFENKNSKDINFKWQAEGFLDREISRFTFVYGLSYGLFSSGWNLDRYINDEKTDYLGARRIEAGDFAPRYVDMAKIWENYIK